MVKIRLRGGLSLSEKDILRFYPDLKPLLGEIKGKG